MRTQFVLASLVPLAAALIGVGVPTAWSANDDGVRDWVTLAEQGLYAPARQTLARIPDDERRLLALRAYLRAGDTLSERWSWSAAQIAAYPASTEGREAGAELQAVASAFARDNPGVSATHQPAAPESGAPVAALEHQRLRG